MERLLEKCWSKIIEQLQCCKSVTGKLSWIVAESILNSADVYLILELTVQSKTEATKMCAARYSGFTVCFSSYQRSDLHATLSQEQLNHLEVPVSKNAGAVYSWCHCRVSYYYVPVPYTVSKVFVMHETFPVLLGNRFKYYWETFPEFPKIPGDLSLPKFPNSSGNAFRSYRKIWQAKYFPEYRKQFMYYFR
jgi:hypothetical protein